MGRHSPLEYLLVCQILCLLRRNEMDRDLNMIEKIYTACLELCHFNDITVPLGQKTCNEISSIISEYDKNREIFESTFIDHFSSSVPSSNPSSATSKPATPCHGKSALMKA